MDDLADRDEVTTRCQRHLFRALDLDALRFDLDGLGRLQREARRFHLENRALFGQTDAHLDEARLASNLDQLIARLFFDDELATIAQIDLLLFFLTSVGLEIFARRFRT